ncbi:ATP-dependent dethiobiotin synthetase BioD [Candidatus Nitrosocosmicus arcticus]|uniref:ATP-dependent dethiobiotin synthetase BioD n=1 Tax=Candidatus Nitrosocosmicus arcticus TaxID=2035267 RepID=A0A557SYE9_9ARCH|nr:ATP-dependent dethiobiotin synthetase BioD [Candidatus Nitrosocosmicus arcticus]
MAGGIFVTGTDTGIGKTLITASLAWKFSKSIRKICVMKPFATGNSMYSKKFNSKDVAILTKAIKFEEKQENLNPYFYPLPCSPFMASSLLNLQPPSIGFAIKKFKFLQKKYDYLLVEGIGGLMVPINSRYTLLDFIKLTKLGVIIVATPKLGTFNHILLSVKNCRSNGIPIKGIVVNKMPSHPTLIEAKIPTFIQEFTKLPILGIIPTINNLKINESTFSKIAKLIDITPSN